MNKYQCVCVCVCVCVCMFVFVNIRPCMHMGLSSSVLAGQQVFPSAVHTTRVCSGVCVYDTTRVCSGVCVYDTTRVCSGVCVIYVACLM